MPQPKRLHRKVEPGLLDKCVPVKRPKTSDSNTRAVPQGELRFRIPSPIRVRNDKDKGRDIVPTGRVKSEDTDENQLARTAPKHRSSLTPKDLPPECMYRFRVMFRPAIRDFVGTLGPWETPSDADIIRIWNVCFPKRQIDASKSLFTIVSKLVRDTIRQWRWDLAKKAFNYLRRTLEDSCRDEAERVAYAARLLGDDEKDRKRPFYYRNYGNGVEPSGIFQSPIIAATFATHLACILRLPEEARLPDYPVGALALSILAAKRALTWAKTGLTSIPKTPEGYFSRANWGDHHELRGGTYVPVDTASNIVKVIRKLRDIQWARILAEAEKYTTRRSTLATSIALPDNEDQSDFEVEDWDDDFASE